MSRLARWLGGGDGEDPADPADRYVDEGAAGVGGTSVVRRVFDRTLLRRIAVKVLSSPRDAARERFLAEAQITGQLEHPGITPVHEYGVDASGQPWISMKWLSGQTLAERIDELGPRRLDPEPLDELISVLVKVCDALAYAHHRGVLHRDIKPANVMIGAFGEVTLLDWGIATTRQVAEPVQTSGVHDLDDVLGTPDFMAPEQLSGDPVDPRTDVYGLGGLLYAVLCGAAPHRADTRWDAMMKAMAGHIDRPSAVEPDGLVPPGLEVVALRALARDPDARHPSAGALRRDLEAFRRGAWNLPVRQVIGGTVIVAEGEAGNEAFIVQRGRCRVETLRRGQVRELGPGDVFGEMAVLAQRPRTSTVRAVTDVTLQVVSRDALEEGLGLDTWSGRFARALAQRFAELEPLLPDDEA